jgi:putative oxidoreductase
MTDNRGRLTALLRRIDALFRSLDAHQWVAAAFARAAVGAMFCGSGFRKLGNLEGFVETFRRLGIPAPELQAPFVATLELVGGAALVLGLATRPFAALLAFTMIVAIATDRLESAGVADWLDFLYLNEWLLLLLLLWLVFAGGGKASLDAVLAPRLRDR